MDKEFDKEMYTHGYRGTAELQLEKDSESEVSRR